MRRLSFRPVATVLRSPPRASRTASDGLRRESVVDRSCSFTTHQYTNCSRTGRLRLETRLCDLALTHRRLQYMYRSCLVCLCVFRLPPVFLNRGEPGHAHTGRAHRSAQSQLKGHTDRRNVPDQADPQTHNLTSHNRSDPQKHGEDQITQNTATRTTRPAPSGANPRRRTTIRGGRPRRLRTTGRPLRTQPCPLPLPEHLPASARRRSAR